MRVERRGATVEQRGLLSSAVERRAPGAYASTGNFSALKCVLYLFSTPLSHSSVDKGALYLFIFLAFSDGHILEFIPYSLSNMHRGFICILLYLDLFMDEQYSIVGRRSLSIQILKGIFAVS